MVTGLDIKKVKCVIEYEGYYKKWLDDGILNLSVLNFSYDDGPYYSNIIGNKDLVDTIDKSYITIFFQYIFQTFGKNLYYYHNEEMEGYNFAKSKTNNGTNVLELLDKIFEKFNVEKYRFILHTGNLNIKDNFPFEFTTFSTISHFIHWKYEPIDFVKKDIIKKFLFLNKQPKNERYVLYEKFKNNNLLENFYYTINAIKDPKFKDSVSLEDNQISHDASINVNLDLFNTSFINIVSESEFINNDKNGHCYKSMFFSEKIAKPLNSFTPFIILGCSQSLIKLKELGFKTFDKWWDESYDLEENDQIRINKIYDLVYNLSKLSIEDLNKMYEEMIPNLVYNRNLYQKFTNKEYHYRFFLPQELKNKKCFYR